MGHQQLYLFLYVASQSATLHQSQLGKLKHLESKNGTTKRKREEAGETIIAAKNRNKKELIYEVTDLWFHSLVLLSELELNPQDINTELERRFGKKKPDYTLA